MISMLRRLVLGWIADTSIRTIRRSQRNSLANEDRTSRT